MADNPKVHQIRKSDYICKAIQPLAEIRWTNKWSPDECKFFYKDSNVQITDEFILTSLFKRLRLYARAIYESIFRTTREKVLSDVFRYL